MSLFSMQEVSKSYRDGLRDLLVLDCVSLEMDAGETVGVLASRRAGKTTLLNIAAGIEPPDSGSVLWEGRNLSQMNPNRRARFRRRHGIALASCDWKPVAMLKVVEHVAGPLYSDRLKISEAERCAYRALELAEAAQLGHRMIDQLSVSERVRVELARALVREPRLLVVDEPAVLPRPSEAREFFSLLHGLPERLDLALLVASEDVSALSGVQRVANLSRRLYSTDSRRKVVELRPRDGRGTDSRSVGSDAS